ncbi:histidine--tRNA ligase [Patescibacteria group bacterium]|nr:histidine--tRNA ligase [Patescibacteria group bacterium]
MNKKTTLLQPPKGFRDYLPEEAAKRRYVIEKMIAVFERFGFDPLETPALEYAAVLEGKYGDQERLIFKFEDRGGRKVALRYDQTVPLARVIARYGQKLPLPFKRYQIQANWRAEKPQAGRYREFTQCDVDIVGTSSPLADAEIIAVVNAVLGDLGFKKYLILFNDRRVLSAMIRESGIKKDLELPTIRLVDKLEKIGEEEVITELEKLGVAKTKIETLMTRLGRRPVLPGKKKKEISFEPIDTITANLKNFMVPKKHVLYTPTLARGLDYYTGMIIETIIEGYEAGSVGGGGRYDNLIGVFAGKKIPAVGFSFGLERLIEAMDRRNLFDELKTAARVLVTIFNQELTDASATLASELRDQGIKTELYLNPSDKLQKQIKYADKKGIPSVLIVGPDEAENGTATVKDLTTGKQETLPLDQLHQFLQS